MTCGPAGVAELDELVLVPDLLLEQPAKPATATATPATPITIPRFTTALLCVAGVALHCAMAPSTPADRSPPRRGPTFMTPFGRVPRAGPEKRPGVTLRLKRVAK